MMCVYPSACYAEEECRKWVKGLAHKTIKKYRGTSIRMGTYIPEFLSNGIRGNLYSMCTYTPEFTVLAIRSNHMIIN